MATNDRPQRLSIVLRYNTLTVNKRRCGCGRTRFGETDMNANTPSGLSRYDSVGSTTTAAIPTAGGRQ